MLCSVAHVTPTVAFCGKYVQLYTKSYKQLLVLGGLLTFVT